MPEPLLFDTATQAFADALNLPNPRAVRRYIDLGFIPVRKLGRRVVATRRDLECALARLPSHAEVLRLNALANRARMEKARAAKAAKRRAARAPVPRPPTKTPAKVNPKINKPPSRVAVAG
jgi:hypothetical protein